jgi:hypothetical protein
MSVFRTHVAARAAAGIQRCNAISAAAARHTLDVRCQPHPLASVRPLHLTTPYWKYGGLRSASEDPILIPAIPTDLPPDWRHESYGFTVKTLPRVILLRIPLKATESDVRALFTEKGHAM